MNDANGNGYWDPGEESALLASVGGATSTRLEPAIENTQVHQTTMYLEREVASDFALRTGFVVNAKRQPYATINLNRPLSAYAVPIAVVDPGPDGRLGSADDGPPVTAYNLTAESVAKVPVNITTNIPDGGSDYYTWEITATKRQNSRWSLLASYTRTWTYEAALGSGNNFSPNALINTIDAQDRFTTWQAKLHAAIALPWGLRVVTLTRAQSGAPVARTFVSALNYGSATIRAEPVGVHRTDTVMLVDLRTEKTFHVSRFRVAGFVDVYNVLNTNAEQIITTSSGASWLRPTTITGPRMLRIGARLDW
jgi:hypothetical protein